MGLLITPVFIFFAMFSLWMKFLLNLVFSVSSSRLDFGLCRYFGLVSSISRILPFRSLDSFNV